MSIVTGVVEAKSKTKYGYGILVTGKWHNSKFEIKCEKGDTVEFDDGGKNYCNKLKVISAGDAGTSAPAARGGPKGSFPIGLFDGQRSIIRQNAVTNANTYVANFLGDQDVSIEDLLDVARQIEAYTTGDLDAEAAEAMVAADLDDVA